MQVTVYVDIETFQNLVLNRASFDALLFEEGYSNIALTVPIDSIYTTGEQDIVTVQYRW
jgi:hypothetical protein